MRAKEFLQFITERSLGKGPATSVPGDPNSDPLYGLKSIIANKIKVLPDTPEVKNQLEDIEDALKHLESGKKRRSSAEEQFDGWSDEDVRAAKSLLARYIVSMNAPFESKIQMLDIWKTNGLINLKLLLSPGVNTIDKIVRRYSQNPAIKEMADDLIRVDSMGKGKGELFLKVLSPKITSPGDNKGDVEVKGKGKLEIKTYDQSGGRLGDQEVVPGPNYLSLVKAFLEKFGTYWGQPAQQQPVQQAGQAQPVAPAQQPVQQPAQQAGQVQQPTNLDPVQSQGTMEGRVKAPPKAKASKGIPSSGLNIAALSSLYNQLPDKKVKTEYIKALAEIVSEAFPKANAAYGGAIATAIINGELGKAKQLYGTASFLNYMAIKHDIGILFINLTKDPIQFTFINDLPSLSQSKLRFHISTAYPVSTVIRNVHPPLDVVPTSQSQPEVQPAVR
jgi:hypothetical protein